MREEIGAANLKRREYRRSRRRRRRETPAGGDAGEKRWEKPLEELLEDDVMVFQPRLRLDCVEPGGEELLPCEARCIHVHLPRRLNCHGSMQLCFP